MLGEGQGGNVLSSGVAHQNTRRGAWPPCFEYQTEVDGEIVFDPSKADEVTALRRAQCDPDQSEYGVWTLPADFFKLRSASVSYRLPDNFLPPGAGSATIQLSGRNLFTIPDWPGVDPEIDEGGSVQSGADGFSRQEYYQLPPLRTFMMNLRVNF